MNPIKEACFTEKYRPDKVENVIGDFKDKILKSLENPKAIPNFLFYSRTPGTGKTTLAKAIIKHLDCDSLVLNASDDRTLEVIRGRIKDFSISKSSDGSRKCCFLDEFDGNLKASQEALRNLMETYNSNIFYILTCNDITKVIDPIKSRCVLIEFTTPKKEDIQRFLENICISEKMKYDKDGLNKIIEIHYPSIRGMVNHLQDLFLDKKEVSIQNVHKQTEMFDMLWQKIVAKKYTEVRQEIMQNGVDVQLFNKYIFELMLYDKIEFVKSAKVIQILARNEKDFKLGADDKIVFIASLPEIIGVL